MTAIQGRRVLVTGGAGFLGRRRARSAQLDAAPQDVPLLPRGSRLPDGEQYRVARSHDVEPRGDELGKKILLGGGAGVGTGTGLTTDGRGRGRTGGGVGRALGGGTSAGATSGADGASVSSTTTGSGIGMGSAAIGSTGAGAGWRASISRMRSAMASRSSITF